MKGYSIVRLALILILVGCSKALDESPDLEYDEEVEDEEINTWMDDLKAEGNSEDELFEQIFEVMRNQEKDDREAYFQNIGEDILETNAIDASGSKEETIASKSHEESKEDAKDERFAYESEDEESHEKMMDRIRELLKDSDIDMKTPGSKSCSNLMKKRGTAVKFFSVKGELGRLTVAHLGCGNGYHLKKSTPQYEVCGKATKFRWTYQLRGKKHATETCTKGKTSKHPKICKTKECFTSAAYYMNKIDFSVHPCKNFFDFACGRWLKETPVSQVYGKVLTYSLLRNNVARDLAKLLSAPIQKSDISAVVKAKTVYKSCMDMKRINSLDSKPLLNFLKGHFQWPVLNPGWHESMFELESTLGDLRAMHNNVLMKFSVRKTGGVVALEMWKGRMAMPLRYYSNPFYQYAMDAYRSLMYDTAIMLGASEGVAHQDLDDVMEFERELAHKKLYDLDYYSLKTIAEMNYEFPSIDWLFLFKRMIKSHPITLNTKVHVWNTIFIRDVVGLITRTPKRVVQNYMMWRFIKHRINNLSKRFELRYLDFKKSLYGSRSLQSRWHMCSKYLMYTLKLPTGKMYIDVYFKPSKKKAALQMFHNIRNGFIKLLDSEVTWMDANTKKYAKEKARAVKPYIGYDAKIYENITYIDTEMKPLITKSSDYFGNVINILKWITQHKFQTIGQHYNPHVFRFITRPTMVNAFYSPSKNSITMPAGELQYPFYWGNDYSWSFQYGAIGTILGHELTHGFDNNGRRYGKHGYLYNWWSDSSLKQFNKRTNCMVKQYSNYYWKTAGRNMNGQKTLGENIADNGGIRESYEGYKLWLKSKNLKGEGLEPSTGLTNDQMFFVGFANVRCAKYTHRKANYEIDHDVHSPGRFRVIGSLQNFDKFSKAFSCPVGSFMNPKHKCIIW